MVPSFDLVVVAAAVERHTSPAVAVVGRTFLVAAAAAGHTFLLPAAAAVASYQEHS